MLAVSHTAVRSTGLVNELRFQVANRDQTVDSLDPRCGGPCTLEYQGGPTLEVLGVASVGRQRFTPQPRREHPLPGARHHQHFSGAHQFKAGFDFNYIDASRQNLPLHFGGRYIFGAIPAAPAPLLGFPAVDMPPIVAVQLRRSRSRTFRATAIPLLPIGYKDFSLFAQDDWRHSAADGEGRRALSGSALGRHDLHRHRLPDAVHVSRATNNIAPRLALAWDPFGDRKTTVRGAYGLYYDNLITGIFGITKGSMAALTSARLSARFRPASSAWNTPGRKLAEPTDALSEPGDLARSGAGHSLRASCVGRIRPRAARSAFRCRATSCTFEDSSSRRRSITTRSSRRSGLEGGPQTSMASPARRRPCFSTRRLARRGTGADDRCVTALRRPPPVHGQLHAV